MEWIVLAVISALALLFVCPPAIDSRRDGSTARKIIPDLEALRERTSHVSKEIGAATLRRFRKNRRVLRLLMPAFDTTRRVQHSADEMFKLVSDVETYPQFLPLCKSLRVLRRTHEGDTQIFVAEMQVGYKAIRETFKTRVSCDRASRRIFVEYIDGPFRYLKNSWAFREVQGAEQDKSHVDFHIEYEFKSRMLGLLMGGMFDQAFRRFADAFERRADDIYGRAAASGRSLA